jgi:hypothetical protein
MDRVTVSGRRSELADCFTSDPVFRVELLDPKVELRNLSKLLESKVVTAAGFPIARDEALLCCFLIPKEDVVKNAFSSI